MKIRKDFEGLMENTLGIYFNEKNIRELVEKHLEWAELEEGQTFCAKGVMSDSTPIGTSIIVGVDGIRADAGSNVLRLVLSEGIYELEVKTVKVNDAMNIRLHRTAPLPGTFGHIVDGVLDILTDEEKEFQTHINDLLGTRDDDYANAFRADNVREIGGRGLILLEKIKAEIKSDDILSDNGITPTQLAATFIEMTEKYLDAINNVDALNEKHDALLATYRDTYDENSRDTKKLARDIEVINRKIDSNRQVGDFCKATIDAAVMPVLESAIAD